MSNLLLALVILATLFQQGYCQCDAPLVINDWNGQIKSPGYPSYAADLDCSWIIKVSMGNIVEISFSDFAMANPEGQEDSEENCSNAVDHLQVYDGNTTSSTLIKTFCGTTLLNGELWKSTKNEMLISMKTTQASRRGFILDFHGGCNRKVEELNGIIKTPKFPEKYPQKTQCLWLMDFGSGMNVTLEFTYFDLENQPNCTYDYVALYAGQNRTAPLIGEQYCGFSLPPQETVNGPLALFFISDFDTEFYGFVAEYSTTDLDECVLGNECDENAFCENTIGSYICTCKHSFQGDGRTCDWYREFDECIEGEDNCHQQALCIDTKNEFNCNCKTGYQGNGTFCTDVNECTATDLSYRHSCHQNATCTNLIGSYQCTCVEVYVGDGFNCTDRNECDEKEDTCHGNATCVNTDGSYDCSCNPGFTGDGLVCQDYNECKMNTHECHVDATCSNVIGSYLCVCNNGYEGNGRECTDVDECIDGSYDCHIDGYCINNKGSYSCQCSDGYVGNGTFCEDVDECIAKTDTCHLFATCNNTKGSYQCSCNKGYQGNGTTCSDLNECLLGLCNNNATCSNAIGTYACTCNKGYSGDGLTCGDVDECSLDTHQCNNFAFCKNTFGSYQCQCQQGFIGTGFLCWDINECMEGSSNCHSDALCTNTKGSFQCDCKSGYDGNGTHCYDEDECRLETDNCHVNGTCFNLKGSYSCECKKGFTGDGRNCVDIDECSQYPCDLNADCKNTVGSFMCACLIGYQGNGTSCSDVDECLDSPCHVNAKCANFDGSYNCSCYEGYLGNGSYCVDTNECDIGTHECHREGYCINTDGSYNCSCSQGYEGSGYECSDIDECTESLHGCHIDSTCSNNNGSFFCTCNIGYFGNGIHCDDVDECKNDEDNKCSNDATCLNTIGAYNCFCNIGYYGNGTHCDDVDECSNDVDNECSNDATCLNTIGAYNCSCNMGYYGNGTHCDDNDECKNDVDNKCSNDATCSNTMGSYNCFCNIGYYGNGSHCDDVDECKNDVDNKCSNDATCLNTIGSYNCFCNIGYYGNGTHCEDVDECKNEVDNECSNDATCLNTIGSYYCSCNMGYYGNGTHCDDVDECKNEVDNECSKDATCSNTIGAYNCFCNIGYYGNGTHCDEVDECKNEVDNGCSNDATCSNTIGAYNCSCNMGYYGNGTHCDDVDECKNNVDNKCAKDATCLNKIGSYYCSCNMGYYGNGTHCEDIDECLKGTHSCDVNAKCNNTLAFYVCTCDQGFYGNGQTCNDTNECSLDMHNCDSNAVCNNTFGNFNCSCNHGYEGNGTKCTDLNECLLQTHKCHKEATCTNLNGTFQCDCNYGYRGNGTHCEDINECDEEIHDCHVDGTCTNKNGSFFCYCNLGYLGNGTYCTDVDECMIGSDNCHRDAKCTNTKGSWECLCNQGLTGDGVDCIDILECSTSIHTCHHNATCNELYSNYSCHCNMGYFGDGFTCSDVDECINSTLNSCHENAQCFNAIGSYNCKCNIGYRGTGTECTDVDECSEDHRCHVPKGECINTIGSYKCRCLDNFIGNGFICQDAMITYLLIVSILEQPWHNDMFSSQTSHFKLMQAKINTEISTLYSNDASFIQSEVKKLSFGSIRSEILLSFQPTSVQLINKITAATMRGEIAGLKVDPSSFVTHEIGSCLDTCSLNAYCIKSSPPYCSCSEGYEGSGKQCIDINECDNMNGGCDQSCVNIVGSYYCTCNQGFKIDTNQRSCNTQKSTIQDGDTLFCDSHFDQGVQWPASIYKKKISKECPNNPSTGEAIRECTTNGKWSKPDLSSCINPKLKSINSKVSLNNLSDITWAEIKQLLISAADSIYPPMTVLYAGDILEMRKLLTTVVAFINNKIATQTLIETRVILNLFNNVMNNIFHLSNHPAWHGLPQALVIIDDYLSLVTSMATILSDHMIEQMQELSIKKPEAIHQFNISSQTTEIDIHIQLVEMRSFNESRFVLPRTLNATYKVIYPTDFFEQQVYQLITQKGIYVSVGCWADYSRNAAQYSLEAKHSLLKDNFLSRVNAVEKCGYVADTLGYNIFILQDGGLCASGNTMHNTYDKDGRANNCAYGKGGIFANSVYEINKFYTGILTVSYKHLAKLVLALTDKSNLPLSASPIEVFGEVTTTTTLKYAPQQILFNPLEVIFNKEIGNLSDIYCAQIDQNNSTLTWSTDGCTTFLSNNRVICNCSRLSHQTLIYNRTMIKSNEIKEDVYYKNLSYISFTIVFVCFTATLLLYIYCRMGKVAIMFQVNIALLMIFSDVIFIFGIGSEWQIEKGLCKALTVLFHFLLTSLFSWFLALSWHSYHKLSDVIKQTYKNRTNTYMLLGYGCPCVMSLLSMAIFYEGFGNVDSVCWISDTLMVSMFLPPIALLIIFNIVVLGMVIGVYFSPRTSTTTPDNAAFELEKDEVYSARDSIRASSLMLPMVTVTWVFGILRMVQDEALTKYAFLILNIVQGVMYFIGYCLLNRQIKDTLSCSSNSDDDYVVDSPTLTNLSLYKLRANNKHSFTNEAFITSPTRLAKATAYDGKNFANAAKSSIPTEVLFEMQQQWYNKKPDY